MNNKNSTQQNGTQEGVCFKVDAELEISGYDPILDAIYEGTDIESCLPPRVGRCKDIMCSPDCVKDVRINYPITLWCRIEKHRAEHTSDSEVKTLMEEAIIDVPEYSWRGCAVKLRILGVTCQDCMDADYQDFCDFMASDEVEEPSQQSAAASTQQVNSATTNHE
jgi:hypothetical protein